MSDEVTEDAPKKKGGKKRFHVTRAARAYDQAQAVLAKLKRGNAKVEKAEERLAAAQKAYDDAVSEAQQTASDIEAAEQDVVDKKAALDAALAGETPSEE